MCRWIAYTGQPIFIDQVVTTPDHSLVQQSFNSKLRFSSTGKILGLNGDGFGLGWYAEKEVPGLYKDEQPAWSNRNLRNLCEQIKAHIFFAHIRASTLAPVERSNCHPFKYKQWLFQHNGYVDNFDVLAQTLHGDIGPDYYPHMKGSTDSETFFMLALTYGLEEEPKQALQKMVKRVREACEDTGITCAMNFSCALSNGETIYTLRYAEGEKTNTQFYSTNFNICSTSEIDKNICPDPGEYIIVVSEPLDQMEAHWKEVPDNTFATIKGAQIEFEDFL